MSEVRSVPETEDAVISVVNSISGNELVRLQTPNTPNTFAVVVGHVATKLGLPEYQILLRETGDECCLHYYVAQPGYLTAEVLRRTFQNCQIGDRGDKGLYSDLAPWDLDTCSNPKIHLGRLLGQTAGGEDIILNCELVLITWRQSAKRYDPQEWSSDYQRLKSAGLDVHTSPYIAMKRHPISALGSCSLQSSSEHEQTVGIVLTYFC